MSLLFLFTFFNSLLCWLACKYLLRNIINAPLFELNLCTQVLCTNHTHTHKTEEEEEE